MILAPRELGGYLEKRHLANWRILPIGSQPKIGGLAIQWVYYAPSPVCFPPNQRAEKRGRNGCAPPSPDYGGTV